MFYQVILCASRAAIYCHALVTVDTDGGTSDKAVDDRRLSLVIDTDAPEHDRQVEPTSPIFRVTLSHYVVKPYA